MVSQENSGGFFILLQETSMAIPMDKFACFIWTVSMLTFSLSEL